MIKSGNGTQHPLPGTQCQCKYRGTLIDGTEFDSGTANFAPQQVIKGWTEAMQLMVEGDEWELTLPGNIAYGDRGSPPDIPPKATLLFTMELQKVSLTFGTAKGCRQRANFLLLFLLCFLLAAPRHGHAQEVSRGGVLIHWLLTERPGLTM